jgi:spermidine/putrescine transport system permease protein
MFLFLYIPIIVLMVFSFNDSKVSTVFTGFTFEWYGKLISNQHIWSSLKNSLIIASISTLIASILGTTAALAFNKYKFPGKKALDLFYYTPIIIPDIILGIALLSLYGWLNITLGFKTVIPGHVAITTSYVMLVVLARLHGFDRSLEEAAKDLGANGWKTFIKVTLPIIFPGVLAGSLLAFTISLDEFVISYFTGGPKSTTLPVYVYTMISKGVSPEINALSAILILLIVAVVLIIGRKSSKNVT